MMDDLFQFISQASGRMNESASLEELKQLSHEIQSKLIDIKQSIQDIEDLRLPKMDAHTDPARKLEVQGGRLKHIQTILGLLLEEVYLSIATKMRRH